MKKIADPLTLGIIAGGTATLVKEALGQYLVRTGVAPHDGIQKGAATIIEPYEVRTPMGLLVGVLVDQTMGISIAVALAALHRRRIVRASPWSGALMGLGAWALWYGGLGSKMSAIKTTTPTGAFVSAGWHLLYGGVVGTLISALGEREPSSRVLAMLSPRDR